MAVTTSEVLCVIIDAADGDFCIPMPGGGEICFTSNSRIPIPHDICSDLFGKLNVAIAGLAPLMCLIDVALALVEVGKAIPDSLGPPPDPTALTDSLVNLVKKAACLLPLIPQLSICPLIKALLDLLIGCLVDIREQLENLVVVRADVAGGRARANELGGVALLESYLDCAEANADLLQTALGGGMESMQRMLDITVNPLMELAGLDPINFQALNTSTGIPEEHLGPLNDLIDQLSQLRDSLPC